MSIVINVPERAQLALDSLNQGKLQCQVHRGSKYCAYRWNDEVSGASCVIGAMLTDKEWSEAVGEDLNHKPLQLLPIVFEKATEYELSMLQRLHDTIMRGLKISVSEALGDSKPLGIAGGMTMEQALEQGLKTLVERGHA